MPRPKKKSRPAATNSAAILIRLTPEDKERLREAARREGLGIGTWLRRLGLLATAHPVTNLRNEEEP